MVRIDYDGGYGRGSRLVDGVGNEEGKRKREKGLKGDKKIWLDGNHREEELVAGLKIGEDKSFPVLRKTHPAAGDRAKPMEA